MIDAPTLCTRSTINTGMHILEIFKIVKMDFSAIITQKSLLVYGAKRMRFQVVLKLLISKDIILLSSWVY